MSLTAIKAGRAQVEIFGDNSRLIRSLRGSERRLNRFAARTGRIGATLFGAGLAAAVPFRATLQAASDVEETMNKFNVVFGTRAAAVKEWGDAFAHQVGRAENQIADFMAGSQDLFVPLGFESGAAEEMSKQVTTLAVDLASFNNKADTDVLRDLHAALTGSGEVMKKYGVIVSEAAVKQELLNQGLDPQTATNQMKVQARLAIILRGTTAAQGDAIRSAGSYANMQKAASGATDDLKAEIGKGLLPVFAQAFKRYVQLTGAAKEYVKQNKAVVTGAALATGGLLAGGAALLGVAATAKLAAMGIGLVAGTLGTVGAAIGFVLSPLGLLTAGIAAVGYASLRNSDLWKRATKSMRVGAAQLEHDAKQAWDGIATALESGDIAAAGRIGWALVELEFARSLSAIESVWLGWRKDFAKGWAEFWGGLEIFVASQQGDPKAAAAVEQRVGREMAGVTEELTADRLRREKKAAEKVAAAQKAFAGLIATAKQKAEDEAQKNAEDGTNDPGGSAGKLVDQKSTTASGIAQQLAYSLVIGKPAKSVRDKTDEETEAVDEQTESLKKNKEAWQDREKAQQGLNWPPQAKPEPQKAAQSQDANKIPTKSAESLTTTLPASDDRRRILIERVYKSRLRADSRETRIDFDRAGVLAESKRSADLFRMQRQQQAEQEAGGFSSNLPHFADTIGRAEQILQAIENSRRSGDANALITSQGNLSEIVAFANANRRFSGQPASSITGDNANDDITRVIDKLDEVKDTIADSAPRYGR